LLVKAGVGLAKGLVVAGVMSGTSADGVDVALCRILPALQGGGVPRVKVLGHVGFGYSKAVRGAVLRVMEGGTVTAAEMSRLHWRLGEVYADCVEKACAQLGVKVGLVGCHGQTVFHEAVGVKYLGAVVRSTWQMGEASVIAERLRVPVVSDFRPADLAAGGQGAPLVPMADYVMFRSEKVSRVLQNLGGIGNLTAIPAGAGVGGVMAFDTGPGNMVIDACMQRLFGKGFDRDGAVGRRGQVLHEVVAKVMEGGYFSALPPKSCGREEFGAAFADGFIAMCKAAGASDADVVATATALTAESVVDSYRRFVWAHVGQAAPLARVEFCVAGGGAKNSALMGMLRAGLEPLGVRVRRMEELGMDAQAKEAVAFALLGWLTWNGLPGNVSAATGAERGVVLGKVTSW
jgi:anhydro-N-acetylmuramic acid kinase